MRALIIKGYSSFDGSFMDDNHDTYFRISETEALIMSCAINCAELLVRRKPSFLLNTNSWLDQKGVVFMLGLGK